jgi:hypothetical protein
MTSDEIIRIAKAVGLGEVDEDGDIWCSDGFYTEEIDSFAQLVAAVERKACAKLLDEMAAADKLSNYYQVAALRIRERGAP